MKQLLAVLFLGAFWVSSGLAEDGREKKERIDVHLHAYKVEGIKRLIGESVAGVQAVQSDSELIAQTMYEMDKNNVRWAIISGNDELIDTWMKQHPNRLIRSYLPKIGKDTNHEAEAEKLIARIEAKDVRAIGELALAYIKMPLNDRTMWPYYRVAEGRVPVFFHTGIGPNRDHGKFNNPQFLGEIAAEFPNLVIVACHMAEGQEDELIQVMKKHERIYADLSVMNWYSYSCRSILKKLKSEGLLNRVLYGSDQMIYPGLISKSVKAVENSDLTSDELDAVFWTNAARIIELPDTTPAAE